MSDQHIIFSPEYNQWILTDGWHYMELPEWAHEIIRDEFERKVRLLQAENSKLREMLRDYEHCNVHVDCESCKYDGITSVHCPFSPCFTNIDESRELGMESE